MRDEDFTPEALSLIRAIQQWVAATKATSGQLGQMVLNHGGFVPLLLKRGTLKPETDAKLRAFMAAFPDRAALPPALVKKMVSDARAQSPWSPQRHRSILERHGYAMHPSLARLAPEPAIAPAPVPAPSKPRIRGDVIRAAKLDGRELGVFVTALIDMGLACWIDDRIEHGEPVA